MTNNTSTKIIKFQELYINEIYHVQNFKPIESKFGKSYILKVIKSGDDKIIEVFSTKSINEYMKVNKIEKHPKKFDFIVRIITEGNLSGKLYAEIVGFNNGFIDLK